MPLSAVFRAYRPAGLTALLLLAFTLAAHAAPPSAPPLTTDANFPNLFYGAIPAGGTNAPVIVFVHGLSGSFVDWIEVNNCPTSVAGCKGGSNDMYDFAYQGGYRTAFLSMAADNSNDNLNIQANGAMLQTLFPAILSHFGVSKVYFVCHSKGGLDLEDAIANPQWIGIASAVIELGTPNQGDALADWLYSPAGQGLYPVLCPTPNAPGCLFNPGVESLEIANVQQLRSQWDPIFQNARIPFYTLSGNTFACTGGEGTCPTGITGPILVSITQPPSGSQGKCTESTAPKVYLCNDGLVTYPETLLPPTYAMELGIINTNHYLLRMGDNSYSYVNGRVRELMNQQPGVTQVNLGGFGDLHNTWSWSMAWFKNMLYVGTGREPYCVTAATSVVQLGVPSLYPPDEGDCTPDYHDLPLQAEIWQYNPATNIWTRVFQSPNSLNTLESSGKSVATSRDIGFRGMTVVNEPAGVTALYVSGVTSGAIFECNPPTVTTGCSPQGTWPPPRILRSTDGVTWNQIPQNGTLSTVNGTSVWTPGQCGGSTCFLGGLTANGTYEVPAYPNYSIRSAAQLCSQPGPGCAQNGVLFLQVGDYPGVGRVFASAPGVNPGLGDNCGQAVCFDWASPPAATLPIWVLENFNNFMYAGTGSPYETGQGSTYGVSSTNGSGNPPYTWNPIITDGAYAQNLIADYAMSMEIFSDSTYCPGIGCLYVGTDRPNEMVRIHPDTTGQVQVDATDSWDLIVGNPRQIPTGYPGAGQIIAPLSGIGQYFGNGFTGHFWRMGVGGKGLFMGTWDESTNSVYTPTFGALWSQEYGTDVWRSPDGVIWTFVSKAGFGDGNNDGSRSFASTPFGLFMGTARNFGGTEVFNVDNSVIDFNRDGVIDQKDVNLMIARLGAKAMPHDPMDLNGDGRITQADVQLLTTQCTYSKCTPPAARPASTTLAPPLVHSASGPQGGAVSLTWNAVSGAMDYLVYRISCSPSEQTPPPAPGPSACAKPNAPTICTMLPAPPASAASAALFGYPSAPELLGRVTNPAYTETAPNTLQSLYFVVAEDSLGNLSSPSNAVGGPSWAGF
jgi:hypothetical protein